MAMTPRSRAAAGSDASLLRAPRSLNELVTWRFSYLTKMSAPVSAESLGAGSMGVRSTFPAIVRRAASMSAMVTLMWPRLLPALRRAAAGRGRANRPCLPRRYRLRFRARRGSIARNRSEHTHDRRRTRQDRRIDRGQAPRLRPGGQSGTVRGCPGAPLDRLRDRHHYYRHSGAVRRAVHPRVRAGHVWARLGAVLAAVAGDGDLGRRLLRADLRQRGLGDHRNARHAARDAHVVWGAGLFRARGGARHRLLADNLLPHPAHSADRLLQRAPPPAARHAGRHDHHQRPPARAGGALSATLTTRI